MWRPPWAGRRSTPRRRRTSPTTGPSATRRRWPRPSRAAAHTTRLELVDNRVMAMPMEPRGCFAEWDGARLHVAFSGQGVWGLRDELAEKLGLPPEAVRVTTPGRRRRLRDQGLQLPGVFRRRLRRARARAAGALDEHPRRGDADRQRRARPRDGGRGGVRRRATGCRRSASTASRTSAPTTRPTASSSPRSWR